MISLDLQVKYDKLKEVLAGYGSVIVAYSSGVDSTFLLRVAHDVLGDKCMAVTIASVFVPEREAEEAVAFCKENGIRHELQREDILSVEGVKENPANRCYICKHALFSAMKDKAKDLGFNEVCEGSNLDDEGDYRPGMKAIAELKIKSPLREAGLTKQDIRDLSKELSLPTWHKPSFACLASRFAYGNLLTKEGLERVDKAECFLIGMGFRQFRVRNHGDMARIEVLPEDIGRFMDEELRKKVYEEFKSYGFTYVSLDLKGYRTGAMNEVL